MYVCFVRAGFSVKEANKLIAQVEAAAFEHRLTNKLKLVTK